MNLVGALRRYLSLGDPKLKRVQQHPGDRLSLPCPNLPAHKFEYSPVSMQPVVRAAQEGSPFDEEPPISSLKEHEVLLVVDSRFSFEEIQRALKQDLRPYLTTSRKHVKTYGSYLHVWDLRQKGWSADKIAPKLWPGEYEQLGGRDIDLGEKGPLIQRVYDQEKAAQSLIDKSFPPRRKPPKIKK